jgi:hypothetical protein
MGFRVLAAKLALIPVLALLGGCSLEAAIVSCAGCGEINAIAPRPSGRDIRLPTDAPVYVNAGADVVYHVRVRMDRGGSRDFVLSRRDGLRVGDRVEIRDGRLVPVARAAGLGLT